MSNAVSEEVMTEWRHVFELLIEGNILISDFKELKSSFVVKIYMSFVKLRMKANLENLGTIGFDAKGSVMDHSPAFTNLLIPRLAKLLNHFFNMFYQDSSFGLFDIITPSRDRTYRFFSYMVDFIHSFDSTTAKCIETARDEVTQQIARKEELDRLICEQQRQLEELHIEQEEAALECLQVDQQMKEMMNQLVRCDEIRKRDAVILKEAKTLDNSLKKQLDAILLECVQIEEAKVQLEQKVLLPHEMQLFQQITVNLTQIQQELESKKKMLSDRKEQQMSTSRMSESVSSLGAQFTKEFNEVFAKLQSLEATSPLTNSEACQAIEEGDMQLQLSRQEILKLSERLDKLEAQDRLQKEGLLSTLECEKEVYNQLRLSKEEEVNMCEQLAADKTSLEERIDGRSNEFRRDEDTIKTKTETLLAKYEQRQLHIRKAVDIFQDAVNK